MDSPRPDRLSLTLAIVAAVFGFVTLMAGGRVLMGADPGYPVYPPLLWFNTLMGAAYLAVGALIWRRPHLAPWGAGAIFGANLAVLGAILLLRAQGAAVASASLSAMAFRTLVWAMLLALLLRHRRPR